MNKRSSTLVGQKFQVGQLVKEAPSFGMTKDNYAPRKGVIKKVIVKKNKIGREHFHYEVLWKGYTSTVERVQHRLIPGDVP
tara:strand:+ start:74 stop:316 length:243 start_codon:yes stop_codon:yes gene_type:complete